jgi:hypothetical protein
MVSRPGVDSVTKKTGAWRTGSNSRKAVQIQLALKGGILALIEPTVTETE